METLANSIQSAAKHRCSAFLQTWGAPITVGLGECANYDDLLRGRSRANISHETLIDLASRKGRVLVCGRGASGKSAAMMRAALCSISLGHATFLIELSRWSHDATEEWARSRQSPLEAFDFLLRRFGAGKFDISDAEFLAPSVKKIFFLDGLNETPGSIANEILAACDGVASAMVGASVIASDRLVRRTLNYDARWCFVMPLAIAKSEIDLHNIQANISGPIYTLLSLPFFLDRAMRGELLSSTTATIEELLIDKGRLDPNEMTVAVDAAWRAYEIDESRSFPKRRFEEAGQVAVADKLLEGGALTRVDDNRVAFHHHWYHDCLAAVYVAKRKDLWKFETRHRTLDALTFKANSFDAIGFVLEKTDQVDREQFLRAVYDWNPYAVGYALSETNTRRADIPRSTRVIMLAMLADRRFDPHFFSAQRALDGLRLLLNDEDARQFYEARTRNDLRSIVASLHIEADDHFEAWRRLFSLQEVNAETLARLLTDQDSILGWTAANVVKQLTLTAPVEDAIIEASDSLTPVVRRRAVHAMGGFPLPRFVDALLVRIDKDEDENVRYGAIRSLVETAANSPNLIDGIISALISRLEAIARSPRLVSELSTAPFMNEGKAPENWATNMSRILYGLADRQEDRSAAEHWNAIVSRLRQHTSSRSARPTDSSRHVA